MFVQHGRTRDLRQQSVARRIGSAGITAERFGVNTTVGVARHLRSRQRLGICRNRWAILARLCRYGASREGRIWSCRCLDLRISATRSVLAPIWPPRHGDISRRYGGKGARQPRVILEFAADGLTRREQTSTASTRCAPVRSISTPRCAASIANTATSSWASKTNPTSRILRIITNQTSATACKSLPRVCVALKRC